MAIVLTGATGFLGGELLVRLLEHSDHEVIALVRAPDDEAAAARLDATLAVLLPPGAVPNGRARAVAAHLDRPGLGLPDVDRDALAADAQAIVHCAASVSFTLPLDEARTINVGGTRAMLDLAAAAPSLERFVHVSTAYVAGDRPGPYRASEGDVGQRPRNTYEQTKLEAEAYVLDARLRNASILRPSIVVGDSRTGWTPAFNVIYWPLRAFARGLLPVVPGDPAAPVDVVPVDTVADALLELSVGPPRSGTFHAVAGDDAPTAGALSELAARLFGAAPPEFVGPGAAPEIERRAGAFLPYFRVRGRFASAEGDDALAPAAPPLERYLPTLLRYADAAAWGRRARPRWAASTA